MNEQFEEIEYAWETYEKTWHSSDFTMYRDRIFNEDEFSLLDDFIDTIEDYGDCE